MLDRVVETNVSEVPDMPKELEKVLLFALDEARSRFDAEGAITPFTALVVKDNVFLEKHPGNTPQECFTDARHTVEGVSGAESYAFCYDGYIATDQGNVDAIIAEGGMAANPNGYAVGLIYSIDDEGKYHFESDVAYIGEAPNFMARLPEPGQIQATGEMQEEQSTTVDLDSEMTREDSAAE